MVDVRDPSIDYNNTIPTTSSTSDYVILDIYYQPYLSL